MTEHNSCRECGAVISDAKKHAEWHDSLLDQVQAEIERQEDFKRTIGRMK